MEKQTAKDTAQINVAAFLPPIQGFHSFEKQFLGLRPRL
jgi:hypothetical protein